MKNLNFKLILILIAGSSIAFTSCKKTMSSQLMGKWKLSEVKIQMIEDMQKMADERLQALKDSSAATTDTAKKAMFDSQVVDMEKNIADFKTQQDSSMKNTVWEFKTDSIFETTEGGKKESGKWWIDDKNMRLFTNMQGAKDSVEIKFEADMLTLQFDSINYMKLQKIKE